MYTQSQWTQYLGCQNYLLHSSSHQLTSIDQFLLAERGVNARSQHLGAGYEGLCGQGCLLSCHYHLVLESLVITPGSHIPVCVCVCEGALTWHW